MIIKYFLFFWTAFFIIFAVFPLSAQEQEGFGLNSNRYSMSVVPKILKNGVQNDINFGFFYTDAMRMAADVRIRTVKEAVSDNVWDIKDSHITRESQVTEIFFLPLNYCFIRNSRFSLQAGAGGYFEYNKLIENGYFNDSTLFDPKGEERYSSFYNDYLGYSIGPLLDIGISYNISFFRGAISFGIVPVFFLNRNQTWTLSPYMNPDPKYSVSSESVCGPYYYLSLDLAFNLKYFIILFSLLNEYSYLEYTAAGFDGTTGYWADVNEKITYTKLAFEISVLVNMGTAGIMPQIGYGRIIDEVTGGKNYFIIGVKKDLY